MGVAAYRLGTSEPGKSRIRNIRHKLDDGLHQSRKVIILGHDNEIVPTDGLIAEWLFNNNLLDTSGNGYELTNINGCVYIEGLDGTSCLKFPINTAYAYRYVYTDAVLRNLFNDRHPWTITFLIKMTSDMTFPLTIKFAETGGLGQFYEPSAAECVINKTSASGCYGQGELNAYDYATPSYDDITLNEYAFVSYKFDGTNICLRVNDISDATPTSRSGCLAYHLYINNQANKHIWTIENLRVWNRALTTAEEDGLFVLNGGKKRINL